MPTPPPEDAVDDGDLTDERVPRGHAERTEPLRVGIEAHDCVGGEVRQPDVVGLVDGHCVGMPRAIAVPTAGIVHSRERAVAGSYIASLDANDDPGVAVGIGHDSMRRGAVTERDLTPAPRRQVETSGGTAELRRVPDRPVTSRPDVVRMDL